MSKAGPDGEGHVRLRCPASNPAPVARCDLKPDSVRPSTQGRLRIPVTAAVTDHPPPICTQQSVTVPPEAGAKFAQPLLHGSDEWQAAYATLRSTNEGMNGFLKDGAREALGDPERRRIRGVAAQSVFVALLLCAANLARSTGSSSKQPPRPQAQSVGGPAGAGPGLSTSGSPNSHPRPRRSRAVPARTRRPPPERGDRTTATVTSVTLTRPSKGHGWRNSPDGPLELGKRADLGGRQAPPTTLGLPNAPVGFSFVDMTCPVLSTPPQWAIDITRSPRGDERAQGSISHAFDFDFPHCCWCNQM